jgi:hypothetical protein
VKGDESAAVEDFQGFELGANECLNVLTFLLQVGQSWDSNSFLDLWLLISTAFKSMYKAGETSNAFLAKPH